jgi:pilus assembly protein TadC
VSAASALAAFLAASAVLGPAVPHRPHRPRRRLPGRPVGRGVPPAGRGRRGVRALRAALGQPLDPRAEELLMGALVLAAPALLLHPLLAIALPVGALAAPVSARRRRARSLEAEVVRDLPGVIQLLGLALVSAGSLRLALGVVAEAATGPVGRALALTVQRVDAGERLIPALEDSCRPLGPPVQPLVRALAGAERYGVPLADVLARLADDARRARRRRAETAARRVPVRLLLPLVCCMLPAFVLLTVAPVVARTVGSLELG